MIVFFILFNLQTLHFINIFCFLTFANKCIFFFSQQLQFSFILIHNNNKFSLSNKSINFKINEFVCHVEKSKIFPSTKYFEKHRSRGLKKKSVRTGVIRQGGSMAKQTRQPIGNPFGLMIGKKDGWNRLDTEKRRNWSPRLARGTAVRLSDESKTKKKSWMIRRDRGKETWRKRWP